MNIDNDSGLIGSDLSDDGAAESTASEAEAAPVESDSESGAAGLGAALQDDPARLERMVTAVQLGDSGEVSDIVGRARSRQDGFAFDNERAIADRPNWAAHESKQLYAFATVNNVPGSAEEIGSSWGRHGTTLQQVSEDLYTTIDELGTAWIGQAAGAAQGALVGIANSSSQAAEAARAMGQRLSQQAAAAADLKKMPQPEEFDPASETANMLAMGPAAMVGDMKEKFDQARAVKAQQVQYLNTYTAAMSEVDNSTPSFGPESLGLKQETNSGGTNLSSVGGPGAVGSVGSGVAGSVGGVRGPEGLSVHGGPAHQPGPQAPQQPAPQTPQAPQQPAAQAPAAGVASAAQAPASSSAGGIGAAAAGAALAGGGAAVAGGRALAKGSKTSSDKDQESEGATTAQSQQAAQPAASVQQPQNSGMPGAGGLIGGREGAGVAPPPGTPMGGGMGAAGAAAGKGQEGEEHTHASFLVEADPDDVFGANQATAPPVLGAWGPDDEE
ncbi:hypothetical protein GCM10009676_23180 [Prauserella halophila]|uniref:PPE family protein n=1 Tax=Prauserella halophila TaxID=185641 RepID=A0ABN1W6J8_9PSEU|nr:hypothetical protein [Prauserella halophila]MCP2235494.1 hypothetical protein [Prauserella halophila]